VTFRLNFLVRVNLVPAQNKRGLSELHHSVEVLFIAHAQPHCIRTAVAEAMTNVWSPNIIPNISSGLRLN